MALNNDPEISVIIPSGRPDLVSNTLDGLGKQDIDRSKFEILIVSPRKVEGTKDNYPIVRHVSTDRLYPPGKMRNIGAAEALGSFLAFIDDDCIPPPNWLSTILPVFEEQDGIAAVGCRVIAQKVDFGVVPLIIPFSVHINILIVKQ